MYSQRNLIEIKEKQTNLNGNTPELVQRTSNTGKYIKWNHLPGLSFIKSIMKGRQTNKFSIPNLPINIFKNIRFAILLRMTWELGVSNKPHEGFQVSPVFGSCLWITSYVGGPQALSYV